MNRWLLVVVLLLIVIGGYIIGTNLMNQHPEKNSALNTTNDTVSVTPATGFTIMPVSHASMVLTFGGQTLYNDPVGKKEFTGRPAPDIILVSDIHPDHLDTEVLTAVETTETVLVAPQAVFDKLPKTMKGTVVILKNGEKTTQKGIQIEAIPMYNMPESETAPHTRGRGNGYVLSDGKQRIYIAGDTGATPEMKALKNIDVAFVPMNLPFTMSVEEAAEGVLAFKPKVVHPYHYRGQAGLADVNKFKQLVESGNPAITVELLDFYPGS